MCVEIIGIEEENGGSFGHCFVHNKWSVKTCWRNYYWDFDLQLHSLDPPPFFEGDEGVNFNYLPQRRKSEKLKKRVGVWCRGRSSYKWGGGIIFLCPKNVKKKVILSCLKMNLKMDIENAISRKCALNI